MKILSNKIKPILAKLISNNQGGFVPKRHILDNIIIVQETIHSSISRNERGMVLKLDMTNSFDRVRHYFLHYVLKKFGFSDVFIKWIKAYITTPWIAPLVMEDP